MAHANDLQYKAVEKNGVFQLTGIRVATATLGFAIGYFTSSTEWRHYVISKGYHEVTIPAAMVLEMEPQGMLASVLGSSTPADDLVSDIMKLLSVDRETAWVMKSILYDGASAWVARSTVHPSVEPQFTWELSLDAANLKVVVESINTRAKACLLPDQRSLFRYLLLLEFRGFFDTASLLVREDKDRIRIQLKPSGRELVFSSRDNPHSLAAQIAENAKSNDSH